MLVWCIMRSQAWGPVVSEDTKSGSLYGTQVMGQ